MGFHFRQGLFRVVAVGVLGCLPALAETQGPEPGSVFTESDRQKYRSCASETNESTSCSSSSGAGKSSKAKGKSRQGSAGHWKCLSKQVNRCMTKKGMSADAKSFIEDRMKLWRMLRPNRAKLPAHEDVMQGAVGKDLSVVRQHMADRFFENPDFKTCLKSARTRGLDVEGSRLSSKEFKNGRDDASDEVIPVKEVRDGLLACADKKKAERDLASKPVEPTFSGSEGTSNVNQSPPPPNNGGGDQPIFSTGASSAQ